MRDDRTTGLAEVRRDDHLLAGLAAGSRTARLVHTERFEARSARLGAWPTWTHPALVAALAGRGITTPWIHQETTAEAAHRGDHVVVATGTASGKSLGYLLPVLTDLLDGAGAPTGRGATALYLSPTKALAADQLASIHRLALPGLRAAVYDGDTATDERRWIREHAQLVLTNPDLVHHSLLSGHARWAPFLRALRYVVIDECHVYRGVFGAHLAGVLRRLRRLAARYGSSPTFILSSATVAAAADLGERLTGLPFVEVTDDGSPSGRLTFALWEPPLVDADGRPVDDDTGATPESGRRSTLTETAHLLAQLVDQDVQTVAFARSRKGVETLAEATRAFVHDGRLARLVAAYRGGYLPDERRELERDLRERRLLGLAATNALELGIDILGLDAVLMAGWPGTTASLWQQAGRAGRAGGDALAVLVADDDPLDHYLVHHPETLFGRPVEAVVVDPDNPYVLADHLAAAAAELPITAADESYFGPSMRPTLDTLVSAGVLRRRPNGAWHWPRPDGPHGQITLRSTTDPTVRIVERGTGRVLGTVDWASAQRQAHTGAVYVHQGRTFVVTALDLEDGSATVVAGDPGWKTSARTTTAFDLGRVHTSRQVGPLTVAYGETAVRSQVTSFLRRLPTGEVLGEHPLDLPESTLHTRGVWWTMPGWWLRDHGVDEMAVPGALHAAEHAAIGLLPLVATADRWDIGGVSTDLHPHTGEPTILVYDGHRGGAGFAERGHDQLERWLRATHDAVLTCACSTGCPSCVQSPKCGNGNEPLDKAGALRVLQAMLDELRTATA